MRALVQSGGSSKGAFSCGVIQYLMGEKQTTYQGYYGVSCGAINSSFLAQFQEGEEQLASNLLTDLWTSLDNSKIYQPWQPFGKLHIPWKMSFYDSSPLQKFIREHIRYLRIQTSGKIACVGTVNLNSGKYHTFRQNDPDFISAVLASCAMPGLFCPIKMKDCLWIDGGCKELSPIRAAIEDGAESIDIVTSSPHIRDKKFIEKPSIVDIIKRAIDLSTDKILSNDLEKLFMYNQLAKYGVSNKKEIKIRIFRPKYNLTDDVLNFDPDKIQEMMQKGYEETKEKCEFGEYSNHKGDKL